MKNIPPLIFLFLCFLVFGKPGFASETAAHSPLVRIAVAKDIDRVSIKMSGAYEISDPLSRDILSKDIRLAPTVVTKGMKGLKFGARETTLKRLRFYSHRDVTVLLNNKERRYRGFIDIVLTPKDELIVINQLEVEDYIKGVLLHEVSNRWPMEALKVQAVAARTYALNQMKVNAVRDFDVTNDIYSQVYGGLTSERYRTNLAVDSTRGEILTYQGKVFPTYFHATCGGRTEDAAELWPNQPLPPLAGVRCIYCRESPHYFWKKDFQVTEIEKKLNAKGFKIGAIEDIAVTQRNKSDRILTLIITDKEGHQLTISGKDFREVMGPNIIRSNNYYIVMQGEYCDLIGKGWGHGVGMCQWGSQGMAAQGFTYDKILLFYYPGTVLSKIKGPDPVRAY